MAHHVAHALPPAPRFVGRDEELRALRTCWQAGLRGVIALNRTDEARTVLENVLSHRLRIGDPRARQTEAILREL